MGIPGSPTEEGKLVNRQALPEIVKAIPFIPIEPVIVRFGKEQYEVRIYRAERMGRGQNIVPPRKAENAVGDSVHDAALQLFGTGRRSGGGSLGAVFADFMRREGHGALDDPPIVGASDLVFDERLPDPGVVSLNIHMSAADHGDLFLTQIRQGARSGLACEPRPLLEPTPAFGYPASLEATRFMVENQEWIDAGRRDGWQPGERLELHREAWVRGTDIFMPETDDRGRPISILDDAQPIVFKTAWKFLKSVGIFKALLAVGAITMGTRVPRDGTADPSLLSSGIWHEQPVRLDLGRNLLFVPTYDDAKPWVARFEDIHLLNRALHPVCEPVHEITEPGPVPRSGTKPPRYVGNLREKVSQACAELRRRNIAIGTATVYDELKGAGFTDQVQHLR